MSIKIITEIAASLSLLAMTQYSLVVIDRSGTTDVLLTLAANVASRRRGNLIPVPFLTLSVYETI